MFLTNGSLRSVAEFCAAICSGGVGGGAQANDLPVRAWSSIFFLSFFVQQFR